jgi:hypothetical protein
VAYLKANLVGIVRILRTQEGVRSLRRRRAATRACGEDKSMFFDDADRHTLLSVRVYVTILISVTMVSACGSGNGGRPGEISLSTPPTAAGLIRINRCVDRLLRQSTLQAVGDKEAARRYARKTYCRRFEQKGWIYQDGALAIAAQTWLEQQGTCAKGSEGEATKTVSCVPETRGGALILDCALLHIVRRSEVRAYIARLQMSRQVECDDRTPADALGVP